HLRARAGGGGRGARRGGRARGRPPRRARGARLRRGRPAPGPDRRPGVGGAGRRGRLPADPETMTPEIVYGRRPVFEGLRGRRALLELHASERAMTAEPWLGEAVVRVSVRPERELGELAGTRDHQGVVALCEPYPYADAFGLAAAPDAVLVCLDGVTDPHNL